jgi:PEP-CTERM motif
MQNRSLLSVISAGVMTLAMAGIAYASAQDTAASVPLPGSLALLTTGAAALAGVSWWLRRK